MQTENYSGDIPRTPLKFIAYLSKPSKWWAIASFATAVTAQLLEVVALYIVARFVDAFSVAGGVAAQLDAFYYWGLIFLGVIIVERSLWRVSGFTGIKWLVEMNANGYNTLFEYAVSHSHTYFVSRFAGSISNKVSNAIDGATRLLERLLWGMIPQIISLIVGVYVFFTVHWLMGAGFLTFLILVFIFNVKFTLWRRPYVIDFSRSSSKMRGEGVDLMSNISAVRQYAHRSNELDRIGLAITERAYKDKRQWFMGDWLMVINTVFGLLVTAAILYGTYVMVGQDVITTGTVVLILTILGRVGYAFTHIGNMLNNFIRLYGESEEGLDSILVDHEIVDDQNATNLVTSGGSIQFDETTFSYEKETIFDSLNITIEPGQRVGLVGPSGAGKSTLVSLLLRQHDIDSGAILIDGQNIAEVTQDSLRQNIALVPQEPMLFHRTIRENIMYGKPDATHAELVQAAERAQAREFIEALPKGYDTLVGERGVKLSGGQKQRVAIARAMLKEAPLLVLDEATSALDSESEVAIQKALEILMEGKTVIAVAHRLSTLRKMDRILVIDKGAIVEDGTHDTLADAGGMYSKLWNHQAGGFLVE
jgi:ATP-binding cassette subfamily B protein